MCLVLAQNVPAGTLIDVRNVTLATSSMAPIGYALPVPGGRVYAPFIMLVSAQLSPQAVLVITPDSPLNPWIRLTGDPTQTMGVMPGTGFDVSLADPTGLGFPFVVFLSSRDGSFAQVRRLNILFLPINGSGGVIKETQSGVLLDGSFQPLSMIPDAGVGPQLLLAQVNLKAETNAAGVAARVKQDGAVMGRDAGIASAFVVSGAREGQFFFAAYVDPAYNSTFTLEAAPLTPIGVGPYATFEVSRLALLPVGLLGGIESFAQHPGVLDLGVAPQDLPLMPYGAADQHYFGLQFLMVDPQGSGLKITSTIADQQSVSLISVAAPDTSGWADFGVIDGDGGNFLMGLTEQATQTSEVWNQMQILLGPIDAGTLRIAGSSVVLDAGTLDGGAVDAGTVDAGTPDGGAPDGGAIDAGVPDAGQPDAGATDGGGPDAGAVDAGPPQDFNFTTCGCSSVGAPWLLLAAVAALRRRRGGRA
jgi:hypothetical protein